MVTVELGGSGSSPSRDRGAGNAASPHRRRFVAGAAVLLLLGGGGVLVRAWSEQRELLQSVELSTELGLASSSTSPPGGSVRFFLVVRNDGALPVSVTSVDVADPVLRMRMRDEGERPVAPGHEIEIPLSVRLTCGPGVGDARPSLTAEIGVRREDGGSTSRPADLRPADLVLDVAASLCRVRPELRDHELSGPVLRSLR